MSNDSIADCLTRMRNAQMRGKYDVLVPMSRMVWSFLSVVEAEGMVGPLEKVDEGKFPMIRVRLKYFSDGKPVIERSRRRSTSGRRLYVKASEIEKVKAGLGISVLSTSQGILSDREARKRGIGGELLAELA